MEQLADYDRILAIVRIESLADCYRVLGLSDNATPEEVRKAYRELAKKFHPDTNKSLTKEEAQECFRKVRNAYDMYNTLKGLEPPEIEPPEIKPLRVPFKKRVGIVCALVILLLCMGGSSPIGKPQPSSLPTITPPSGWRIAFQITKDATKQGVGVSQRLSSSQIPPSASYIIYGVCVGNGSIATTISGTSAHGSSTFTDILSDTCTLSSTHASVTSSSTGNGGISGATNGEVAGIWHTSDVVEQATINLRISGPVKWEVVIEEPV